GTASPGAAAPVSTTGSAGRSGGTVRLTTGSGIESPGAAVDEPTPPTQTAAIAIPAITSFGLSNAARRMRFSSSEMRRLRPPITQRTGTGDLALPNLRQCRAGGA